MDRGGITRVLQEVFVRFEVRSALSVPKQECKRIGADDPLRQRVCLREKEPVPVTHAEAPVRAPQRVARRHDVEHGELGHDVRGIERQAVGAARPAIMSRDVEAIEAQLLHDCDLVARHGALGIRFVIGAGGRFAAAAVPAQVGTDDRVMVRKARRDLRPHRMRLGKAVQEEQRRT
jgi:hypothetical protein